MFVLFLLLYHHATRANNIALLAFLLMSQFVCAFDFFVASTAWHLQLVAAPHVAFSVIKGKFLFAPTTLCLLQVKHVTCKKVFAKSSNWLFTLLTAFVSPGRFKTLHAKPTKTVTAWRRHLRVENWIFARQSKKPDQKHVLIRIYLTSYIILTRHHRGIEQVDHCGILRDRTRFSTESPL